MAEKTSLYLKRLNLATDEVEYFPNDARPAKIIEYEYSATRMGGAPTIEGTVEYQFCLDSLWKERDEDGITMLYSRVYVEFNDEKFYVEQVPSSSKSNTSDMYTHEVQFVSARIILENIFVHDVVSTLTKIAEREDLYRSNSTSFSFYGDINEFVTRINESLVFSNVCSVSLDDDGNIEYDGYHIVVDDGVETDSLEVSFDNSKVADALQEIYNVYELTYYWVGTVCHVGTAQYVLDDPLSYGKDNGLLSVEKENSNTALCDRVTGYGGSTNIQYYYPNQSASGTAIYELANLEENNVAKISLSQVIKYCPSYEGVTFILYKNNGSIVTFNSLSEFSLLYDEDDTITTSIDLSITTSEILSAGSYTFSTHLSAKIPSSDYVYFGWQALGLTATSELTKSSITEACELTAFLIPFSDDVPSSASAASALYDSIDNTGGYSATSLDEAYRLVLYMEYTITVTEDDLESLNGSILPFEIEISLSGTIKCSYVSNAKGYGFLYNDDEFIAYTSSGIKLTNISSLPYASNEFTMSATGITETESGLDDAAAITITDTEKIATTTKLMPSIYRESLGEDLFYPAVNYPTSDGEEDERYLVPDTDEYYLFVNEYNKDNPHEGTYTDDDIYPTIKNVYNANGDLIGEILDIAFDEDDDDSLTDDSDEEDPEYIHSYFYIKLHIFDGDMAFNLFDCALYSEEAYLTMTDGSCQSCSFQIAVEKEENDDGSGYNFYNPVLTDDDGNLLKQTKYEPGDDDYHGDYILGIDNISDPTEDYTARQQDTTANEVWIAVKKENDTFGIVMPNATNNYKPSAGDTFVLTGIGLPQTYIDAAERKLDEALIQYMKENNEEQFTYKITFSRIWIEKNADIAAQINENTLLTISYNGVEHALFVSSYKCSADDNILMSIEVELSEELTLNQSTINTSVSELKGSVANLTAAIKSTVAKAIYATTAGYAETAGKIADTGELYDIFLRKDADDVASGIITFLSGIKFGSSGSYSISSSGAAVLASLILSGKLSVSGATTTNGITNTGDIDNSGEITTKDLTVTGTAHFFQLVIDEVTAAGGSTLNTVAGGFTVDAFEEIDGGYRLYWRCEDDGVYSLQKWAVDDQALCYQATGIISGGENVSTIYWWALVTAVSSETVEYEIDGVTQTCHWIEISSSDYDGELAIETGIPVAMLGNRSDTERQGAQYTCVYKALDTEIEPPFIAFYNGIDDYDLASHRTGYWDKTGMHVEGYLYVDNAGTTLSEYVESMLSDAVQTAAAEVAPYIDEETGTWWTWDATTNQFVDSGVIAQGASGADGADGADALSLTVSPSSSAVSVEDGAQTVTVYVDFSVGTDIQALGDDETEYLYDDSSEIAYDDGSTVSTTSTSFTFAVYNASGTACAVGDTLTTGLIYKSCSTSSSHTAVLTFTVASDVELNGYTAYVKVVYDGETRYAYFTLTTVEDGAAGADGADGADGVSACSLVLTNEAEVVACDGLGNVADFDTIEGTSWQLYLGTTALSISDYTYTVTASGCVVSTTTSGATGTITLTEMSEDTATVTISATYSGVTLERIYTLSKNYSGISYAIVASPATIVVDSDGNLGTTSITYAVRVNDNGTVATYTDLSTSGEAYTKYGLLMYWTYKDGTTYVAMTSSSGTLSLSSYATDIISSGGLEIHLYKGTYSSGTLVDKEGLEVVSDGEDGEDGEGGLSLTASPSSTAVSVEEGAQTATVYIDFSVGTELQTLGDDEVEYLYDNSSEIAYDSGSTVSETATSFTFAVYNASGTLCNVGDSLTTGLIYKSCSTSSSHTAVLTFTLGTAAELNGYTAYVRIVYGSAVRYAYFTFTTVEDGEQGEDGATGADGADGPTYSLYPTHVAVTLNTTTSDGETTISPTTGTQTIYVVDLEKVAQNISAVSVASYTNCTCAATNYTSYILLNVTPTSTSKEVEAINGDTFTIASYNTTGYVVLEVTLSDGSVLTGTVTWEANISQLAAQFLANESGVYSYALAVNETAEQNTTDISTLQQTASNISLTVQQMTETSSDIGTGRTNLIEGSKLGYYGKCAFTSDAFPLEEGETYIAAAKVKVASSSTSLIVRVSGGGGVFSLGTCTSTEWTTMTTTFTATATATAVFSIYPSTVSGSSYFFIDWVFIAKGSEFDGYTIAADESLAPDNLLTSSDASDLAYSTSYAASDTTTIDGETEEGYIYYDNTSGSSNVMVVSQSVSMSTLSTYCLTFYAKGSGSVVAYLNGYCQGSTADGEAAYSSSSSSTSVGNGTSGNISLTSVWTKHSVVFTTYGTPTYVRIGAVAESELYLAHIRFVEGGADPIGTLAQAVQWSGLDITAGQIVATTDTFVIRNTSGVNRVTIDADGAMVHTAEDINDDTTTTIIDGSGISIMHANGASIFMGFSGGYPMCYGFASSDDSYEEVWNHVSSNAVTGLSITSASLVLSEDSGVTTFTLTAVVKNGTGSSVVLSLANMFWFVVVVNWGSGGTGLLFKPSSSYSVSLANGSSTTVTLTATYSTSLSASDITYATAQLMYGSSVQNVITVTDIT